MTSHSSNGFTLIELLTTLLVAAVIFGIGVPALTEFVANNRVAASANDIISTLHIARTEAIKRRANVTICPSADSASNAPTCDGSGSFADGWIAFVDCSVAPPPGGTCGAPNYAVDSFDTLIAAHGALDDGLSRDLVASGTPAYVAFAPTGVLTAIPAFTVAPKTDFQLCDDRGNKDVGGGIAAGRWLRISPTGRPQLYRHVADVQSSGNPLGGC